MIATCVLIIYNIIVLLSFVLYFLDNLETLRAEHRFKTHCT